MEESARTTELDWHRTLQEENEPVTKSLEMLRRRLHQGSDRGLTPRQAELLLPGAVYLKEHGGKEYDNDSYFIDQIIAIAGQPQETEG